MTEKIILLASHNKGKVKEFNELLSPYGFKAVPADELGIDMEKAQETAPNFRGNSLIKATYAYQQSEGKYPVISDDSGLCVWGLNGFPGVHSARFNVDGDYSYKAKQLKIIDMLKDKEDKSASFFCVLTYIDENGEPHQFMGEAKGHIAKDIHDCGNGFGFDPIFFSDDLGKCFGEASSTEKDSISHRGKATKQFLDFFEKKLGL